MQQLARCVLPLFIAVPATALEALKLAKHRECGSLEDRSIDAALLNNPKSNTFHLQ